MHKITQKDIAYAEGIAYNLCPIKDTSHPLFRECMSAARYGLVTAAVRFDESHPKSNWSAFKALRIRGEVMETIRRENIQGNIGLSYRGRYDRNTIELEEIGTMPNLIDEQPDSNPEEALLRNDLRNAIRIILFDMLPEPEATVIELFFYAELDFRRIRNYIHSKEPVEEILQRGLQKIKKLLIKYGYI